MTSRFPGWLLPAMALPATLVGHALAYFLAGYSQADGRHGYLAPMLEYSVALLAALCLVLVARALAWVGWVDPRPRSLTATWTKLAAMQVALFALLERNEGYVPALTGCAAQVFVALCAALILAYLARVLARCHQDAASLVSYLRRLRSNLHGRHVARACSAPVHCLSFSAAPSCFPRPPPLP